MGDVGMSMVLIKPDKRDQYSSFLFIFLIFFLILNNKKTKLNYKNKLSFKGMVQLYIKYV